MLTGTIGWPDVAIALVAGLPAIIAALTALMIRHDTHSKNGYTLAQTVEHAHDKTLETNAVVTRALGGRGGDVPEGAPPRTARERNGDSEKAGETATGDA